MIKYTPWEIFDKNIEMSIFERLQAKNNFSFNEIVSDISDMHNPLLINDMEKACVRLAKALVKNEKVLIHGDYDVDGVTSTTILYKYFKLIGINCDYYIPNRLNDSYGISKKSINYILENKYSLVITVDCGITALEEIEVLKRRNVDVIVSDHHECKQEIPQCIAVLNCKREDNTYPFKELCGAGIALKITQALSGYFKNELWKNFIQYAAIGTIADIVPLIDENRIIVKNGLEDIKKTKEPSITSMLKVIDKYDNIEKLTSTDIAFYIAPLINASSRMGHLEYIMTIMLSDDESEILDKCILLKELNENRKIVEKEIIEVANKQVLSFDFDSKTPIIVYGENWPKGIIGIVASKLVSLYARPCMVFSLENNIYHGSCRSYNNINILDILNNSKKHIYKYGGHAGAAGLSVKKDEFNDFKRTVEDYCKENLKETFTFANNYDFLIRIEDINSDFLETINLFEPYGYMNESPTFVIQDVKIGKMIKIGKQPGKENAHLKFMVSDGINNMECLSFFTSDYAYFIKEGDVIDISFTISINEWKSKKTTQLFVKEVHYAEKYNIGINSSSISLLNNNLLDIKEIISLNSINEVFPDKDDFVSVYKSLNDILLKENIINTDIETLSLILKNITKRNITPIKLYFMLKIYMETNNFIFKKISDNFILIASQNDVVKNKISENMFYNKLMEDIKNV